MYPAIFLDRDGVIIENRKNYVRSWDDVEFIPHAISALTSLTTSLYRVIIVTNQSAVGRGILALKAAQYINHQLVATLATAGCRIDGVFMCPHAPQDQCACRKPSPGLILQAAQAHHLDLAQSIMIGDAWSDVQAGVAAGVRTNALVLTGRGAEQLLLPRPAMTGTVKIFPSLSDALTTLVNRS
jgi:D-glycero-D-manno-heptose 1,7-bisphosphate phosphatase